MKKLMLLSMLIFCVPLVLGVRIEQVIYDPLGSEAGGEAIVLFNEQNASVDVSSWIIKSETSDVDATIPEGVILYPGKSYLIADVDWDNKKDDLSWRSADYEEAITLANSDGGVALLNGSVIVDALGWGESSGIEAGLFLGTPAVHVQPGKALVRINDTGDNSVDFIEDAFLKSLEFGSSLEIVLVVEELPQELLNISIKDDDSLEGLQFLPIPGELNVIAVEVVLLRNVSAYLNGELMENIGNSTYVGNLTFNYTTLPGDYNFEIVSGSFSEEFAYEILSVLGVALDASSLAINGSAQVIGDEDLLTLSNPTFQNIGNTPLDLLISGSEFVSENEVLPASIFSYSFGDVEEPQFFGVLDSASQLASLNLEPGKALGVNLRANLPENAVSGEYRGSVIFSGRQAE